MDRHTAPVEPDAEIASQIRPDRIFAIIDAADTRFESVWLGHELARVWSVPWEAVFLETPAANDPEAIGVVGDALSLAGVMGAAVYRLPAAVPGQTLAMHMQGSQSPHVVTRVQDRTLLQRLTKRSLIDDLIRRDPRAVIHVVPGPKAPFKVDVLSERAGAKGYLVAFAGAFLTLALTLAINFLTGARFLSILFLFPVLTAAARLGLGPAILAALVSTVGFNFIFLNPPAAFDPRAGQSWLMFAMLVAVAVYTWWITNTLRGRVTLSDRSAQESAALAAFGQRLTRVADWTSTAETVCEELHTTLGVNAVLVREIRGELELVSAVPASASLEPLDRTALEWAWQHQVPTGSGTSILPGTNWQFRPLVTSLGSLAVVGLASEDGRNPVPAERELLLGTLLSQAALAHERLRLEDRLHGGT